jgi:hypothetical protein
LRCALAKGCGTQNYLPITSLADGAPPAKVISFVGSADAGGVVSTYFKYGGK